MVKKKALVIALKTPEASRVPPYDHAWKEQHSGNSDNCWWYLFNKEQRRLRDLRRDFRRSK